MTDNYNLERFLTAQKADYLTALSEVQAGRKQSHWMWYIFPQVLGLGFSDFSKFYGVSDIQEAEAYLKHRVLGPRLILISAELLNLGTTDPYVVFGSPDERKLQSCMTLFSEIEHSNPVFEKVLEKFFGGRKDNRTLKILSRTGL